MCWLVYVVQQIQYASKKVIQLYNGPAKGSENWNWDEKETGKNPMKFKIIYNVTRPILTIYSPELQRLTVQLIMFFPVAFSPVASSFLSSFWCR